MVIFLQSEYPQDDVVKVLEILQNEEFLGSIIYDNAIVAIDDGNGYRVIHPDKYDEEFIV